MNNNNNHYYYEFIASPEAAFLLWNESFESVNQGVYSQCLTTSGIQNKEKELSNSSKKVSGSFFKRRNYKYFEFNGC